MLCQPHKGCFDISLGIPLKGSDPFDMPRRTKSRLPPTTKALIGNHLLSALQHGQVMNTLEGKQHKGLLLFEGAIFGVASAWVFL